MEESDTVVPVFSVGDADYEMVMDELSSYPQVNTKGIFTFKGNTNQVHLFYGEDGASRTECSMHICKPIPFAKIKPHLGTDGVLINMVSGFDITLETMDLIRMETRDDRIPIHFDFHSLTLGIDQQSARFRRPLPDWRRWSFMVNSTQLSEKEAKGLTIEKYDEENFINQFMSLMTTHLIITRGDRGAALIEQENKKLTRHDIPGIKLKQVVDTTGCGDVFGAAFFYFYLKTKDAQRACHYANQFAAHNATFSGSSGLKTLSEFKRNINTVS